MTLPPDYLERVYAGVLGKLVGVYLGRPFEGWSYARIQAELGEIRSYVHDRCGVDLVVSDDDITGTFTFLRALEDHGYDAGITPEQIGQTWLNYLVEGRTILWWGGLGRSSEHTAYLRLKQGIPAPHSGSIAANGPIVAQQIGAQIFIDGWAMVAPGDPALAASLARRAASVSHDGEAIYAAQLLAAMQALAFVESDIDRLLEGGLAFIPRDSRIYRLADDLRQWRAADQDWRVTRRRIARRYGYRAYGGGCHVIPNHALILLGLLYGGGDFQQSLMVCNTSGWDTDCNSGNLGCLLGIRNGLAAFEGDPDWRGPVADRLFLPSADGGSCITDAVIESYRIANTARALNNLAPLQPKGGARFHFELPGSVQGFSAEHGAALENVPGRSRKGARCLKLSFPEASGAAPARIAAPTFFLPDELSRRDNYDLVGSPSLYPGQHIELGLSAASDNPAPVSARLFLEAYGAEERLVAYPGPSQELAPDEYGVLTWKVPQTDNGPVARIGVQVDQAAAPGQLYIDYLNWGGPADTTFTRPASGATTWRRGWVDAVDQWVDPSSHAFQIVQNSGRGLLIAGTRGWQDYRLSARITPAFFEAGGIAARVQGLQRYYALLLARQGVARLVKVCAGETILAETRYDWDYWKAYDLCLEVAGSRLRAWLGQRLLFTVDDAQLPLASGGIALVCEQGHLLSDALVVQPLEGAASAA